MIGLQFCALGRRGALAAVLACSMLAAGPAVSQPLQTVDPNTVIDGDLVTPRQPTPTPTPTPVPALSPAPLVPPASPAPVTSQDAAPGFTNAADRTAGEETPSATTGGPILAGSSAPADQNATYSAEELLPAAEGVFGKGARGLAQMIADLLKKQGRPNGYIIGTEGGGAFVFGLRYGSGTLYHKIEGQREVHWTGPSFGPDFGGSGGRTFILVYNLYDTADLYHRYAAGEGQAYFLGGFNISELKRNDVVLIPVRLGIGMRLGLNVGYMKFSEKRNLFPF